MSPSAKKKIIPILITFCILVFGFALNAFVSAKILPKDIKTEVNINEEKAGSVCVMMNESKSWIEDSYFHGGQYDFTIINNTDADIAGWTVTIPLTHDIRIIHDDDIWNVSSYEQKLESLTVTPIDTVYEIKPGEQKTFGMVLVSKDSFAPETVTITPHYIYHATKRPTFIVLVVLSCIWALWHMMTVGELRTMRKNVLRERHDKEIIIQTMSTFTSFIDAKDPYTKGHSQRVATIASEIARRMGLDEKTINYVYYAGILHDSGKIGIPDSILKKVGILTPEEYDIIKTHPTVGGQMLKDFTSITGIREGAMYHHERYDGTGYPEGLKGEHIPLFGRIISVADAYDAMARDRCYRKHIPQDKMLSEFKDCAGKQFDPDIADIMIEMINDGTAESLTKDL